MSTILTVVKDFCYEMGITPVPTTLVSPTDNTTQQLIRVLSSVHRDLRSARCWKQQKKRHTFSTSNGVTTYQLPKDFFSLTLDTQWNQSTALRLVYVSEDGAFTERTQGNSAASTYEFRLFGNDANPNSAGGQFEIYPAPGSTTETFYFEYISRNLLIPGNWAPSTAYTVGTYVNANGNIYLCDTNGTSGTTAPTGTSANIVDNTTRWDYVSDAYETVIADTDLSLWEDELINLGLKSKWRWTKGFNWEKAEKDFKDQIEQETGRFSGVIRGSLTGRSAGPRFGPATPGGWSL